LAIFGWMRGIRITCVFILASLVCFAQQDSLYTDTVIVVKDPHVITKQVFITPIKDTSRNANHWQIEVFYLKGNVSVSPENKTTSLNDFTSHLFGLQVYRLFRSLEIGMGLSMLTDQFQQQTSKKETDYFRKDSSFIRLLDSYVQTVNGKDTTIYITEPADTVLQKTNVRTSIKSGNAAFSYLQIPLSIGFRINIWNERLLFTPKAQLILGLRTQFKTDFEESMHKIIYNYGFQTELRYTVFRNLEIKAKANWQSNFSRPFYGEEQKPNWSWLAFGLGLGYNF
jgi:hypothetical protein